MEYYVRMYEENGFHVRKVRREEERGRGGEGERERRKEGEREREGRGKREEERREG